RPGLSVVGSRDVHRRPADHLRASGVRRPSPAASRLGGRWGLAAHQRPAPSPARVSIGRGLVGTGSGGLTPPSRPTVPPSHRNRSGGGTYLYVPLHPPRMMGLRSIDR